MSQIFLNEFNSYNIIILSVSVVVCILIALIFIPNLFQKVLGLRSNKSSGDTNDDVVWEKDRTTKPGNKKSRQKKVKSSVVEKTDSSSNAVINSATSRGKTDQQKSTVPVNKVTASSPKKKPENLPPQKKPSITTNLNTGQCQQVDLGQAKRQEEWTTVAVTKKKNNKKEMTTIEKKKEVIVYESTISTTMKSKPTNSIDNIIVGKESKCELNEAQSSMSDISLSFAPANLASSKAEFIHAEMSESTGVSHEEDLPADKEMRNLCKDDHLSANKESSKIKKNKTKTVVQSMTRNDPQMPDVKEQLKQDLSGEVRQEIKLEVKHNVKTDIKPEMKYQPKPVELPQLVTSSIDVNLVHDTGVDRECEKDERLSNSSDVKSIPNALPVVAFDELGLQEVQPEQTNVKKKKKVRKDI